MNKKLENSELIDAYLDGKLSGKEKLEFEEKMQTDPVLETEFQLQKDIVNSLKEYRKAELKARLDNINVGSGVGSGINAVNWVITAGITSMIGLGAYLYLNQDEEAALSEPSDNTELNYEKAPDEIGDEITTIEPSEGKKPSFEEGVIDESIAEENKENEISEITDVSTEEKLAENIVQPKGSEPTENEAEVEVIKPNVIESFEEDGNMDIDSQVDLPENNLSQAGAGHTIPLEVESKDDEKHHFHYRYYNSKLYLYGDFKNIPYELIELNTSSGKNLYMYYKGSFYYIQENQMQVKPLKKIKDVKLIEQLDGLRDNN